MQSVVSYMHDTDGAGVTVIVDGFDELTTNMRNKSFFRELIEGDSLPEAQVVVTSRPYASACLHQYVQRRIEILGFEKSSKEKFVKDALSSSPSKLQMLNEHFQQYPNIDALCYIPLNMAIIIYLCLVGSLPSTATGMYKSFIMHTVCRHLKRIGKVYHTNIMEDLPQPVQITLRKLGEIAFHGLIKDKIVFTKDDLLLNMDEDDPTCYGLLQSVQCYCSHEIGNPMETFNFLHLGIQEYLAAKHVTTLSEDDIYSLLKESFLTVNVRDHVNDKTVRFSNMWILYCGITNGRCNALQRYLGITRSINEHIQSESQSLVQQPCDDHRIFVADPVDAVYLFQCFQEANDNKLCNALLKQAFGHLSPSPDYIVISFNGRSLLPAHLVSLGFFLSRSPKWKELCLYGCHIGDHGINILHKYISGNKLIKQEIRQLDLSQCGLSEASSSIIGDIIIQLEPCILKLNYNSIIKLWDISAAVVSSVAVKVLAIAENNLTSEVANELSNMMYHLEELDISGNKLDEHAAVVISEAIKKTKTLIILNINNNKIKAAGATVFADSLEYNASLKVLYMNSNDIGQDGATAMAKAIAGNKTLLQLYISSNYIGWDGAVALSEAIAASNSLEGLDISDNGIKFKGIEAVAKV